MEMMKKTLAVLLLSLFFAVPAFAHDKGMRNHRGGEGCDLQECAMEKGGMMGRGGHDMMGMCLQHAEELGLKPDQVAKLKAIHRDMKKSEIRFEADKKIAHMEMMEIMEVKDFDLQKAQAAAQKVSDLQRDHRMAMLKSMKEARSILTDDQFKKMRAMHHRVMGGKDCGECGMMGPGPRRGK